MVVPEDFDSLFSLWKSGGPVLNWNLVFTLPVWLKVWWEHFGGGAELYLRSVRQEDRITGIAPLQIKQGIASIIGSVSVCDYQDFVLAPGNERFFYNAILDDLLEREVNGLHLETIRPDSTIANYLLPLARERGYPVEYQKVDVSADIRLPSNWDEYLALLDSKQRHEIKRKMRNLQDIGETSYLTIADKEQVPAAIETFLHMFPESRGDKAVFMTGEMQAFFRSLSLAMAGIDILRFGVLRAGDRPTAMVMFFDYDESIYLYNSAYDPAFKSMSVGIISKARCIQESIARRKRKFDFLKGPELYKSHLGGQEIPLYSCRITLK
jgi:CelD/BcsL family acetyltransferase involved in cellulose biosynthesis